MSNSILFNFFFSSSTVVLSVVLIGSHLSTTSAWKFKSIRSNNNSSSIIQRQFAGAKTGHQSWKSRARNSLWKAKIRRPSISLNPSKLIRKQLAQTTKNLFYNPSDPLHGTLNRRFLGHQHVLHILYLTVGFLLFTLAYPNQVDLAVHSLFQRVATFEINNAATVRTVLDSARIVFWTGIAVGTVGLVVPLAAAALPILARRRSSTDGILQDDDEGDGHSPEYWNYIDQMAQTVLTALQNGQIKYQL